jgi:iron complex outermembrane receptor protein
MQDGEYKLYEVDSKRDDNGGKLFIEKRIGANHSLTTGLELKDGNVNGSDIYYTSTDIINNRGKIDILSAFIMDEFYLFNEDLIFNMGLRYDYAKFYNGLFTIEDPSYSIEYLVDYQQNNIPSNYWSSISPKFSFQYKFSEKNRLYFSSGKGFSAPGLDNMCRSSKTAYGFTRLNPELKPEYLYNIETGADFQIVRNFNISQSVYYSTGKDFLYTVSTNDSVNMGYTVAPVFQTENISKVEMFGTETSLNYKLKSYLETFVNYTFMHSQIKDFKPKSAADFDLSGKFLNSIPFHKITAGISGKYKSVSANLLWKYIGDRYINDRNVVDQEYFMTDKFPAYNQFDIRISGQYKERVTLGLNIENVFDIIYNNYKGYLCPGRFIMIELLFNIN